MTKPRQAVAGRCSVGCAVLAAVASGALHAVAEPPFGVGPLALVCLVPLLHALAGRGPTSRALLGLACGLVLGGFAALVPAAVGAARYFDWPLWKGLLAGAVPVAVCGGGSFAAFGLLAGNRERQGTVVCVARAGAALAAAELLRSTVLGFPWLLLPHALASTPWLAQLAAFGGSLAVSFWLGSANASLALLGEPARRPAALLCGGLLAMLATAGALSAPPAGGSQEWGTVRVADRGPAPPGMLRILVVQPNLSNAWRRDPLLAREALERHLAISQLDEEPSLVVWPENAVHVLLPANRGLLERAADALAARHLLLGAPRSAAGHTYNSALLVGPGGRLLGVHDKVRLFPFTERAVWPFTGSGRQAHLASPGDAPQTLPVEGAALGPLICFEVVFADLAREHVRQGAGLLVNLSNDAWVAGTGGAEQHLAAAVLRAIEFRRPLLRSTTTGISAAIDPAGRTVVAVPEGRAGRLLLDVRPGTALSLYARWGDLVGWCALVGALIATATDARAGRS